MVRIHTITRTHAALLLIFVLTLGTRVAWYASNPHPYAGPWVYGALAHNIIADGHWFQVNANAGPHFSFTAPLPEVNGHPTPVVAPAEADLKYADAHPRWVPYIAEPVGEAVLLTGLWEVTGSQTYASDVLMKIVLDAFAALLVYRIAMRLFKRRRAALVAGFLYALYPPMAEVVVNPNRDIWSLDFTIVILAAYLEALNSKRPGRWLVACGLLTGIGAYFDTGVILFPGAMALATVAVVGWRTTLRRALIPTAIALLLIAPWTIRNYNDFHKFIPLRIGVWSGLWAGLGEIPNHYGPDHRDYAMYEVVRRARPDIAWDTPAWDSYLGKRAFAVIESHPLFYLRVVARRVWVSTLGAVNLEWMHTGTKTPFAYARGPIAYTIEHPFQLLQVALMPLVFLLAMLSLGFTWRRYKHEHLLLIAIAVVTTVPYLILSLDPRYTISVTIFYFLWIGVGSDLLLERLSLWRTSRRSRSEHDILPA
jgi:4-amino-4-deoxy-L-arabinose transferase-like glycosyltransferase